KLDFCSGLDHALRADGVCPVARFTCADEAGHAPLLRGWLVFPIARPQCRVVMDVFLGSQSIAWSDQYHSPIWCDFSDANHFSSYRSACGSFSGATGYMGRLRRCTERGSLDFESLA